MPPTDSVQGLKILKIVTPLPIHFQLNLNTNTERVNSLNVVYSGYTCMEKMHYYPFESK